MKITKRQLKRLIKEELLKEGIGITGRLKPGTFTDRGIGSWKGNPVAVMNRMYVGKDYDRDTLQLFLRQYQGKVEAQQRHKGTAAYDENAAKMVELLQAYIDTGEFEGMRLPREGAAAR